MHAHHVCFVFSKENFNPVLLNFDSITIVNKQSNLYFSPSNNLNFIYFDFYNKIKTRLRNFFVGRKQNKLTDSHNFPHEGTCVAPP